MTTEELVVLDQQSKESLKEIQKMSNVYVFYIITVSYCLYPAARGLFVFEHARGQPKWCTDFVL